MVAKIQNKQVLAFILALTGVIFFSAKAVFVKVAYEYNVDALSLLALRLLFALPVYIGVVIGVGTKEKFQSIQKSDYFKLFFLGFIGYYLASYLDFAGLNYVSASLERLILFVYPTLVLIISAIFMRKKATLEQKIAVVVTYVGVLLAFYKNTTDGNENIFLGSVLIFLSALLYAAYLVGSGNLIPRIGARLFTGFVMIISTVASLIHFFAVDGANLFMYSKEVYIIAVVMAIISTVIPSFLIAESIRLIGSSNVAVIGSVGPISTIVLAAIFLGERISFFQMLGTLIVISGVMLLAVKRNKSRAKVNVR